MINPFARSPFFPCASSACRPLSLPCLLPAAPICCNDFLLRRQQQSQPPLPLAVRVHAQGVAGLHEGILPCLSSCACGGWIAHDGRQNSALAGTGTALLVVLRGVLGP